MNNYRNPADLTAMDVCPRCNVPLFRQHFNSNGVDIVTWHCAEHGDVVPKRSHVSNPPPPHRYPSTPETLRLPQPADRCDQEEHYAC